MLEIVSKGFRNAKAALTGCSVITEENIAAAVREIRVSLLEADVEIGVVRAFLDRVKTRAIGEVVQRGAQTSNKKLSATPGEHFVLICHRELEKLMGPVEETPIVYRRPYSIVMLVGLQGTGKTTTCGKLASYLLSQRRKPLLVAADIYRPAAVEQLKVLGAKLGVSVYAEPDVPPPQLCQDALREAKRKKCDVVIFDTAGRLAIDDTLMQELEQIKGRTRPDNILLVCDAMAGQDTVRTASEFNRRLNLTGFIMTKLDGDARGGAALSIKEVTGKPIKFLGTGETLDKLEPFRPAGLASRILGMGDIVGLMKDFEAVVDEKQAERDAKKLLKGQFTLDDFLKQMRLLRKMGPVKELYEKLPLFGDAGLPEGMSLDDNAFGLMESMIQSMTRHERREPSIIDASRARRIALGAGRQPEQVKDLVARFDMMRQMMAGFATQPGLLGGLPGMRQLAQLGQLKGKGLKGLGIGDAVRAMSRGQSLPPLRGQGVMGLAANGLPGLPGFPGGLPGLPGLAGLPGGLSGRVPGAGGGVDGGEAMGLIPGFGGPVAGKRQVNVKQKQKARSKRKAERQARKKGRKGH